MNRRGFPRDVARPAAARVRSSCAGQRSRGSPSIAACSGAKIGARSRSRAAAQSTASDGDAPVDGLPRAQRDDGFGAEGILGGHFPLHLLELELALVARQAVEVGAEVAREGLEAIER